MKWFTSCSGPCWACYCDKFCVAGHGDDEFVLASVEEVEKRLKEGRFSSDHEAMENYIKTGVLRKKFEQ